MVLCSQSLYREGGNGWGKVVGAGGRKGVGWGKEGKGNGGGERVELEGDYSGKKCYFKKKKK